MPVIRRVPAPPFAVPAPPCAVHSPLGMSQTGIDLWTSSLSACDNHRGLSPGLNFSRVLQDEFARLQLRLASAHNEALAAAIGDHVKLQKKEFLEVPTAHSPRSDDKVMIHLMTADLPNALEQERSVDKEPIACDLPARYASGLSDACNPRRPSVQSLHETALWLVSAGEKGKQDDSKLDRLVKSNMFESFFMMVIVINCATMGMDAHYAANEADELTLLTLTWSEQIFTILFTIELLARVHVYGLRGFDPRASENLWNCVDAFLVVVTGILFVWVLPLLSSVLSFNIPTSTVRLFTVFRALRIIRLVRVVRKVRFFHEVWMLLRGLSDSMRTLLWTCVVIFFLTYSFAVFGMVLISRPLVDAQKQSRLVRNANTGVIAQVAVQREAHIAGILPYVIGLDSFMYTLIQVLLGDSWNSVVRDILSEIWWAWIYFYLYVAVAVFVLMNLVTAIIVENALSTSRADEEQEMLHREKHQAAELTKLNALFKMMDSDGDGQLSWDEFKESFDNPNMSKKWRMLDFQPDECKELFALLDTGDGNIDMNEFFDGLRRMKGTAQSRDLFHVKRSVDQLITTMHGLVPRTGEPAVATLFHDRIT